MTSETPTKHRRVSRPATNSRAPRPALPKKAAPTLAETVANDTAQMAIDAFKEAGITWTQDQAHAMIDFIKSLTKWQEAQSGTTTHLVAENTLSSEQITLIKAAFAWTCLELQVSKTITLPGFTTAWYPQAAIAAEKVQHELSSF